nr:MAG TPA: hypothetical protein [Caudoviricetes sp.]
MVQLISLKLLLQQWNNLPDYLIRLVRKSMKVILSNATEIFVRSYIAHIMPDLHLIKKVGHISISLEKHLAIMIALLLETYTIILNC